MVAPDGQRDSSGSRMRSLRQLRGIRGNGRYDHSSPAGAADRGRSFHLQRAPPEDTRSNRQTTAESRCRVTHPSGILDLRSVLDAREFRACLALLRPASAGHRRTSPHVRRFRTILSQWYSRTELRPSDLAQELNVSLWHLGHLIKRHTGRTILWHLHQFRTSRAAELLSQPELSIKEISALVGYRSTSALDRHFRLFFGVSPSFYRIPVPQDRL